MKIRLNKYLALVAGLILLAGFSSCIKNKAFNNETDFSGLQDHVLIQNSGTTNFGSASVGFSNGDTSTVTLIVNLASVNLPNSPVTVTIGVDQQALNNYNTANGKSYVVFPSNAYKIASTKLTIPAGQQFAQTTISFYKPALDPSISYMLPISITDASGKALTSNLNTVYYHVIGNPLAGNYLHSYWRWNNTTDTTSPPNSTVALNVPKIITPITATSVLLPEYYLYANLGVGFTLSFSNNAGVLSNFALSIDPSAQAVVDANQFQVTGLKLVKAQIVGDASTKYAGSTFRLYSTFINNAGGVRAMVDEFVKQ